MPAEIDEMQSAFADIMGDLNGDGKRVVQFIDLTVLTDERIEENQKKAEQEGKEYKPDMDYVTQMRQKYKLQLAAGDAYLLLVDPQLYMQDYEVGMFETLESLGVPSDHAYDDSSIKFRDTDYGKLYSVFEKLPDDTLMCMRVINVTGKARGKTEQAKFDSQLELMKKMLAFQSSENE